MSQKVDAKRIAQFRKDRKLLPYDDIVIAKNMRVDRSNYSKVTNEGPVTNAFLNKFYTAFEDDLKRIKELEKPVEKEGIDNRLATLEQQVGLLVQNYGLIVDQVHRIGQTMTPLIIANTAKVEEMISILNLRKGE